MTNKIWALPLALAGAAAIGVALTMRMGHERRKAEKRVRKEELHAWEAEGGSTAPRPVTA
jgi:hypothetical protein